MTIELKEGMTLVCKTSYGNRFTVGEKYPVIKSDNGEQYIKSKSTRWFNNEMPYLEASGNTFEVLPYTPEPVTELKTGATLVCTSNGNDMASYFTVGKKYPVIRATRWNGKSENCIESDSGTKWWNDEMGSLTNSGLVFQEYTGEQPKTLIPPHDRDYQAGDVLKMTSSTRTYWTKDREYQIYEDADGLYVIDDDYWDKAKPLAEAKRYLTDSLSSNVLSDMKFVKHVEETKFKHAEAKVEQPEPEFNYTVKAANLKELNAVLYSAYQYTQTMLETNDKLEDYQREHDIAKENLEELLNNVTKGERVLINTDKIDVVREREYSNRKCADVFLKESNLFKLYETMDDIAAMASCVRSFK